MIPVIVCISHTNLSCSNILWSCQNPKPDLKPFQDRGYFASPFPEGDGIAFGAIKGQSDEQILTDIKECFGFEIKEVRK